MTQPGDAQRVTPRRLRHILGAAWHELPLALWGLRPTTSASGPPWVHIRNRGETLTQAPRGRGVRCDWPWTSDLNVARVFPWMGRCIMRRALRDFPVELATDRPDLADSPQVSFVLGHRGLARLPHLLATLATIAAQRGASCECIVVEQSSEAESRSRLPGWVRYVHTPPPVSGMPYNRAWALNVGAAHARGRLLVLHDGDMLVPRDYGAQLWHQFESGAEVVNLKRFVFYLERGATERFIATGRLPLDVAPEAIVQNLEAGGSLAISGAAYAAIGGFDESFVGWGGEDNEFWERACTRIVAAHGYLPILHLWHAPQPGKARPAEAARARALYDVRSRRHPAERAAELRARGHARPDGPVPAYAPACAVAAGPTQPRT